MNHFQEFHVGTSGWTYDDWVGPFYPERIKPADRLPFYATQFDTLEINATFYRTPTPAMIDAWNRNLPESFHLVVKGPQAVTHFHRLENYREPLAMFWDRVRALRTLRVVLWQLPASIRKDVGRLDRFLADLPRQVRHALEFRHASWWDDDVAKTLRRHDAAMVAVSLPSLPEEIRATTDFLYLRFHGLGKELYRHDYSREELDAWAARLRPHLAEKTAYAFFNNGYDANAPRNAVLLRTLVAAE